MSQEDVLKAVEKLKFTSFEELKEELYYLTPPSLSHSLTALTKWKEIITMDFGVRKVYFSEEFWEEISIEYG